MSRSGKRELVAGDPCRKCGKPLVRKVPNRALRPDQSYYYDWILLCPKCRWIYNPKSAIRWLSDNHHQPQSKEIPTWPEERVQAAAHGHTEAEEAVATITLTVEAAWLRNEYEQQFGQWLVAIALREALAAGKTVIGESHLAVAMARLEHALHAEGL